MYSQVLDKLCLAHNPRWIDTGTKCGWHRYICSNCGETIKCREYKIPKTCPNCKEQMTD